MTAPAEVRSVREAMAKPRTMNRAAPHDEPPPGRFDDEADAGSRTDSPLRILEAADLWAPRPPVAFAVGGVLPRTGLGLLVATGASMKSWAALDLVIAKASGGKWLGRFPCEQGPALFGDWENGEDELCRRSQLLSPTPIEGVAAITMPSLFLNSDRFEAAFRPLAERFSLMVIDSLAAGTIDLDENDARFARSLYTLKALAESGGCAIFVLHHSRKAKEGDDARERPRGTSAIFAACDVVLQLSRAGEGVFRCAQTKARIGKAVEPFDIRVTDLDERTVQVRAFDPGDAADEEVAVGTKSFNIAKGRIVALLANERDLTSANEIHRRVRGTKRTNLEALKELEERGTIGKVDGVYRLLSEVSQ